MNAPRSPERPASPFGSAIPLGRWAGVSVGAHWSVLVALALFTVLLAGSVFPDATPGHSAVGYWITACLTAVVFLVTLLAHELAHAVTARHYGMAAERITLWMLGGMTELDDDPPSPRADAAIAGAGPATSLLIGLVLGALAFWLNSESLPVVALAWLAVVNVLLAVFNLLPGAPLDGGRLLRAFVWWRRGDRRKANNASTVAGRALGMALVAIGLFETLVGYYGGLWLALIGWFIMSSATGENQARTTAGLRQVQVHEIMTRAPAVVPGWWTVEQFLAGLDSEHARQVLFPLVDFEGRVIGALAPADLERLGTEERETVRMRDVSRPMRLLLVRPGVLVSDLAASLPVHGGIAVVVDDDSKPLGLVSADDVVRAGRLLDIGWLPHDTSGDRENV